MRREVLCNIKKLIVLANVYVFDLLNQNLAQEIGVKDAVGGGGGRGRERTGYRKK